MSTIDVNACNKRGTLYFCTERNAIYRDLEETCLGALYMKKAQKVIQYCKFKQAAPVEFVLPYGNRRWLIYSPKPQSVNVECPKREEASAPVIIKDQVLVSLKEGCIMKLERSVISADDNFHREMTIFYGSIEGDLFKGTEASSLAIDMARTDMGFKNFTGYQDFESLKSFEFSTYFSKSNIVLYVFVAIVVVALTGVVIFFCLKFKRESRLRKSFHRESHSKEKDWAEKFSDLLFESARKGNQEVRATAPSASQPRANPDFKEETFAGYHREERSHLLNDKPPMRSKVSEISKSQLNLSKVNDLSMEKKNNAEGETVMKRRFVLKKPEFATINSVARKPTAQTASGTLYPNLDEKAKACVLKKSVIEKMKGLQFLCNAHDPKKGCSGVFLSAEAMLSAKSLITEEDIANE